ncbi:packaged DNA stabilization protein [Sphingobium sp. CR2-8]|uniref:packaged DNA stabilization protein n=1 Tax=Sphingobium sp. CR2-8 TaxID=1306534 RepID=UPI002DB8FA56|nr:packaged DNA stabilization protein [Sphingobium sp. CR2-8]MEC3912357.1 packaged DNA stabilization protein [Sphingobium sp. CR2-8]
MLSFQRHVSAPARSTIPTSVYALPDARGCARVAPGISRLAKRDGADRGGKLWNGICYRVIGTKLVTVSAYGAITELGDVGRGGRCWFDYSFDRLAIGSGDRMYYWDGSALNQVSDPDLGQAIDGIWLDGQFMTTDGEYLVVTELNNPTEIDPLKYGSSEADPDPVLGLIKVRGEAYALNRYTIENFTNSGSSGFPFVRNSGALISYGVVGTHAKAAYVDSFAFVGSAKDEALGVYLAGNGDAAKLSNKFVDDELKALTDEEAAAIEMEARVDADEQRLLVHLPTKTLVYYATASQAAQSKVWAVFASGVAADKAYRGRNAVLAYGKFIVGDRDGNIGYIDSTVATHYGEVAGRRFDTTLIYNDAGRGIINSVELTGLPGRAPAGTSPRTFMSWTIDGVTWSQERAISTGRPGERAVRVQWRPNIRFNRWIGLRFREADEGMAAYLHSSRRRFD